MFHGENKDSSPEPEGSNQEVPFYLGRQSRIRNDQRRAFTVATERIVGKYGEAERDSGVGLEVALAMIFRAKRQARREHWKSGEHRHRKGGATTIGSTGLSNTVGIAVSSWLQLIVLSQRTRASHILPRPHQFRDLPHVP